MGRRIKSITDLDSSDFIIKWRMTEMCNASCSYCIRARHGDRALDRARLETQNRRLKEVAGSISHMLSGTQFNDVKLDLIGGEVSILNLTDILSAISCRKIRRVNLTTNLLQNVQYYADLCGFLHSNGIKCTAVASFHYEFQDIESYFRKIEALRSEFDILACEMVSNTEDQGLCLEFMERCVELGIDYMVEGDLRIDKAEARRRGLVTGSSKKVKHDRYKVCFMDGTEKNYTARNALLMDADNEENRLQKMLHTQGFVCTNSYNFVYIDYDMAVGRTESNGSCTVRMPIEKFRIVEPGLCPHQNCTLCGHMSLWRP